MVCGAAGGGAPLPSRPHALAGDSTFGRIHWWLPALDPAHPACLFPTPPCLRAPRRLRRSSLRAYALPRSRRRCRASAAGRVVGGPAVPVQPARPRGRRRAAGKAALALGARSDMRVLVRTHSMHACASTASAEAPRPASCHRIASRRTRSHLAAALSCSPAQSAPGVVDTWGACPPLAGVLQRAVRLLPLPCDYASLRRDHLVDASHKHSTRCIACLFGRRTPCTSAAPPALRRP